MNKRSEPIGARLMRTPMSRYERERRQRQIIIVGSLLLALVTVVLVAAALVDIFIVQPQRAVASVGDQVISVQQLQKRMRYDQAQLIGRFNQLQQEVAQFQQNNDPSASFFQQFYQQQLQQIVQESSAERIAQEALSALIDDLLIRQEASRRGITVSPDEVTEELERGFGFYRKTLTPFPTYTPVTPDTPAPTPTAAATVTSETGITPTVAPTPTPILPTATPRLQPTSITEGDFRLLLQNTLADYQPLGITEQDLRELIAAGLYRRRLQEAFAQEVPKRALHYKFDYVRFNSLDEAQKAADRLARGELDFTTLISQTNAITQPAPIGNGASVDWISRPSVQDRFGADIADRLTDAPLGTPTPIITSAFGSFYILFPLGREDRPLSEGELVNEQRRAFDRWLSDARENTALVKRLIDPTTLIPQAVRDIARNFVAQYGGG
ncbi:MAG: SurA N-terminal domain-containing protein [Thermoflexales bacterium]|nr:SurA N-terminal domain-containing protein [Thermoflexales bacterium]MDW8351485.1 SurA N-terminal domain-containing protein [Anaerolineae bacterium]